MTDIVVLKVGGSLQGHHLDAVVEAIRALHEAGQQAVVVHGGGPRITAALAEAGIEASFVDGQRVTSPEAMVVVERVLAHEINGSMVAALRENHVDAVGLSGADAILVASPIPQLIRVGRVTHVFQSPVRELLSQGRTPVIAPVGCDDAGNHVNINADLAASALAGALGATRVVFLTDVPGIYSDFAAKELITEANSAHLKQLRLDGRFQAGMIPKVEAVISATDAGVKAAYVVHGADGIAVRSAALGQHADTTQYTRIVAGG